MTAPIPPFLVAALVGIQQAGERAGWDEGVCHCGDPVEIEHKRMCAPCAYAVHETCTCSCAWHSDKRQPGSISGPKPFPCTCGEKP